jgi:hypothetical protein
MKPTNLITALLVTTVASIAADLSGHWEGSIQTPTKEVTFEVDLANNNQGGLTGAFSNPSQNLKGLPLSDISVDGKSIRFQIKGTPGERAFKGTLSADGKSISGDYTQSGYAMPFRLARTGDPRFESAVKNGPIGKELEGAWNGTLDAGEKQLRAVLTLSNQPNDTATGSILSVDEGLEIPIATITQNASSLTLDLKAVGASYSATLTPDGKELAGTYTQGSLVLPLNFRRAHATEGEK